MTGQVYAFLASILCGMFAVAVWYGLEAFREVFCVNRFINAILDVIWWTAVTALLCYCLWCTVSLDIRLFEFIGVGIGVFFCYITLGKCLKLIFSAFLTIFLKIIRFIFKILLTPWTFLYKILIVEKNARIRKGTKHD